MFGRYNVIIYYVVNQKSVKDKDSSFIDGIYIMWQALRKLIAANPMGMFLWGIIAKWYFMIAIASLVALFWVVQGLNQIGFIDYMYKSVVEVLDMSKAVAQNCTTKLGNVKDFWECLGNPGQYDSNKEAVINNETGQTIKTGEKTLEQGAKSLLPKDGTVPEMLPYRNPYDTPETNNQDTSKNN